ncbi:hypothetical protein LOK49_LG06G00817 [Camellia lanceoleosa]|uniref:Uncharacterized protein n=1 Tax=Camellia lanceoleosa TaxID=1840588 RepID=A0ACC0HH86_9ERIC|nr:hypothetical protein LOK49_LG06G00817 [Camellia lanceoleosa]
MDDGYVGVGNGNRNKGGEKENDENGANELVPVNTGEVGWSGSKYVADGNDARMSHTKEPIRLPNSENVYKIITGLEATNKSKDFVIAKLEEQVGKLTKALEVQASNLFVGFNECLKVKEEEIARLSKVIVELRSIVSGLEDQLAGHNGHKVIGGHNVVDNDTGSDSFAFGDVKNAEDLIHDVTQRVKNNVVYCNESPGVGMVSHEQKVSDEKFDDIAVTDTDVEMVRSMSMDNNRDTHLQSLFVWKIKNKVRRERKLPEYEYLMARRRLRRVGAYAREPLVNERDISFGLIECDGMVGEDDDCGNVKIHTRFGLNN